MTKVKCVKCRRKDAVRERLAGKVFCLEYRMGKKKPWQNWKVVAHPAQEEAQPEREMEEET